MFVSPANEASYDRLLERGRHTNPPMFRLDQTYIICVLCARERACDVRRGRQDLPNDVLKYGMIDNTIEYCNIRQRKMIK